MGTSAVIVKAESNGIFKADYIHYNGYLEKPGLGYILWHYYNNDARAEQLVSLGDMQSIGKYIKPSKAAKTYGWDGEDNGNDSGFFDLASKNHKKWNQLLSDDDHHTTADYRDQFTHSTVYKKRNEKHNVQEPRQMSLFKIPSSHDTDDDSGLSWNDCKPFIAKSWNDFLDHGPGDFEYLYLFCDHQWHCLICDELGVVSSKRLPVGLSIGDTVKSIHDLVKTDKQNWQASGDHAADDLVNALSKDLKKVHGKKLTISDMHQMMTTDRRKCHDFQKLYEHIGESQAMFYFRLYHDEIKGYKNLSHHYNLYVVKTVLRSTIDGLNELCSENDKAFAKE